MTPMAQKPVTDLMVAEDMGVLNRVARLGAALRYADNGMQGGHHIPETVIRRRFTAGRENFHRHYAPGVDSGALYNNAGEKPALLNWSEP